MQVNNDKKCNSFNSVVLQNANVAFQNSLANAFLSLLIWLNLSKEATAETHGGEKSEEGIVTYLLE